MTPPTGSVAGARERDDAVHLDDEAGLAKPWTTSSDAITVNAVPTSTARASPRATPIREGDAGRRRDERREHDGEEMRLAREHHLFPADEVDQRRRNDRNGAAGNQQRHESVTPHEAVIGTG